MQPKVLRASRRGASRRPEVRFVALLAKWQSLLPRCSRLCPSVLTCLHGVGVFRDPNGNAIDLRPAEGRPCYSNLTKKTEYELLQLVEVAIKNQMEKLKESVYDERATHKKLQAVRVISKCAGRRRDARRSPWRTPPSK